MVTFQAPLPPCRSNRLLETLRIFELKHKIVIVATDRLQHEFWRIMSIDRSLPRQLLIDEDPNEYTPEQCRQQVDRLLAEGGGTTKKPLIAYGILGFIRLVESYHMAIIERQRPVGRLLGHEIFALDNMSFLQVFSGKMSDEAKKNEAKYIKYLSDSHLASPCFFSYTYDLSSTLQSNMGGCPCSPSSPQTQTGTFAEETCSNASSGSGEFTGGEGWAGSREMFSWNEHLLNGGGFFRRLRNKQWAVRLISGYFEQRTVALRSSSVVLTLIARRSRHFSGTRFLKRGITHDGFVANQVETEHILSDGGLGRNLSDVLHSSYVQVRGSVPLFWSQISDAMVPKPDVTLQYFDPAFAATRKHLHSLVAAYGAPLIIFDLLKVPKSETRNPKPETPMGFDLLKVFALW
jgi:hypothetical protein